MCNSDNLDQYTENWLILYYRVIMQLSSAIDGPVDMQIWTLSYMKSG